MEFEAKNNFDPDALNPEGGRDVSKDKKKSKEIKPPTYIEQVVDQPEYELRMNGKGRCLGGVKADGTEYSEFVTFYSDLNFDQAEERAKAIVDRAFAGHFRNQNRPEFKPDTAKVFVTVRFEQ